jgi:hypothetical protein
MRFLKDEEFDCTTSPLSFVMRRSAGSVPVLLAGGCGGWLGSRAAGEWCCLWVSGLGRQVNMLRRDARCACWARLQACAGTIGGSGWSSAASVGKLTFFSGQVLRDRLCRRTSGRLHLPLLLATAMMCDIDVKQQ